MKRKEGSKEEARKTKPLSGTRLQPSRIPKTKIPAPSNLNNSIKGNTFIFEFKGSLDPSHFILEINVGTGRIRHRTTLNLRRLLNDLIFRRF